MYIGNPLIQSAFLVDTFSGDNSTKIFTMSVAPANTASVLVAVSGVLQDPSTYSVVGTTLTFTQAPPTGTGNISARYLGIPASGVTTTAYRTVTTFTATASQTTFTPPSYTVGFINVYRNGVLLTPTSDYTASNGTTVVLASGAASGDTVIVESFLVSSVLNAIPNTAGSVGTTNLASSLTLTTPTISGNLSFASGTNGIVFNNTNATVNSTLNDYETGTWTPTFTSTSATFTYSPQSGSYVKVGQLVYAQFYLNATASGTTTNQVTLGGLPFTTTLINNPYEQGTGSAWQSGTQAIAFTCNPGTTNVTLWRQNGGVVAATASDISAKYLVGSIIYRATF